MEPARPARALWAVSAPILVVVALVCLSGLPGCARVIAPSGGPEDTEAPLLLEARPPQGPGAAEIERVELVWSERLDKTSAVVSLFPELPHQLSVRGSELEIGLTEPLDSAVTLVMVVSRSLSDTRGNSIGLPVSLVFSTADSLPSNTLDLRLLLQGVGAVSPGTRVEVMRAAGGGTILRVTSPDTTGRAVVPWLEEGTFVVRAFEDQDFDRIWSPDYEAGAETTLVVPAGADTTVVEMSLSVVDTIGPGISEAEALDAYHVTVDFTEQLGDSSIGTGSFSVTDSSGTAVEVHGFWLSSGRQAFRATVATGFLGEGDVTIRASGMADLVGNITPVDSITLEGSSEMPGDTLHVISHLPMDGQTNAIAAGPFYLAFSHWVSLEEVRERWLLSSVVDSMRVPGVLERLDGRSFSFVPEHELLGDRQYVFRLLPGITSVFGDTLRESSQWAFMSEWGSEPGRLSGAITGASPTSGLILQVAPAGASGSILYLELSGGTREFSVDDIPAGRYTVAAFSDLDGDSEWAGPSEPYGAHPGVVEVLPGLESGGVDIEILP